MKKIDYQYPVTSWEVYDFIDCFSSLYMFLEKMSAEKVDYYCCKQEKGDCYGCKHGLCRETGFSPAKIQEILGCTFSTLSGTTSAIAAYGRESDIHKSVYSTDDTINFILKYTGYNYEKHTDDLIRKATFSIDADVPVLIRLKDNRFRTVIGYDGNSLIAIQKSGERVFTADEIDNIYVIIGKAERTHILIDALKRIKHVMECNREDGLWDEYIENFRFWGKREDAKIDDIKNRFSLLKSTLDSWFCHNFAETFRHKILAELKDQRLENAMKDIDRAYDDSHTAGWEGHALFNCRDWSKRHSDSIEGGYFELAVGVVKRLKNDDKFVYDAICEMIGILESDN
jgi:hypothetical protein